MKRREKQVWHIHKKIAVGFDWDAYLEMRNALVERVEQMITENSDPEREELLFFWRGYLQENELSSIRKALVGVDEKSIALRTVSPFLDIPKKED